MSTARTEVVCDPLSGSMTILAPARRARPVTVGPHGTFLACPFCPEGDPGPEIASITRRDSQMWQTRALPNLYPLVAGPGHAPAHEVLVVSPDHDRHFDSLPVADTSAALRLMARRCRHHLGHQNRSVNLYGNVGRAAGASQAHPHLQLVALEFVPPALQFEIDGSCAGPCLLCGPPDPDLVVHDGIFKVICPASSRARWEMLVYPSQHQQRFGDDVEDHLEAGHEDTYQPEADDPELNDKSSGNTADNSDPDQTGLALALQSALHRLDAVSGGVDYNLVWHSAPTGSHHGFHWHIHILPRCITPGGFELGTGMWVADLDGRQAAEQLRSVIPDLTCTPL